MFYLFLELLLILVIFWWTKILEINDKALQNKIREGRQLVLIKLVLPYQVYATVKTNRKSLQWVSSVNSLVLNYTFSQYFIILSLV